MIRLISYVRIPRDAHSRKITRRAIFARDKWTCQYCGGGHGNLTVDHVIPRSKGGTSGWDNIVTCCAPCNRRKGDRLPKHAGMHPRHAPKPPSSTIFVHVAVPRVPDVWQQYLPPDAAARGRRLSTWPVERACATWESARPKPSPPSARPPERSRCSKAAPVAGLGVLYLLAVLLVAFRRGEVPALATAVASVLTLNFFFIRPRHQLTIADSHNVAALGVFLIAGVVVSRLAASARQRANESAERARVAAARERESSLLLRVASSLLSDGAVEAQLEAAGSRLTAAVAESGLRLELAAAPSPREGEALTPLRLRARRAWLYSRPGSGWSKEDVDRIAEPLARLVDVALEREEIRERSAEAEAARRADVAKTAVLHAISHDLRSPLTAITTATDALRSGPLSEGDEEELLSVLGGESARLTGWWTTCWTCRASRPAR